MGYNLSMKLEIYNSFCKITGKVEASVDQLLSEVLSYENDIGAEKARLFYTINRLKGRNPIRVAAIKKLKALEASQFVQFYKNKSFPTGHLNIVKKALAFKKATYSVVDHRNRPGSELILKWNNRPFKPRPYQQEAIDLCVKEGRGVIEAAVGSGKSLIAAYVIKELAVNTIVVVPSTGLSLQIYNDFKSWFGASKVGIVNTAKVRKGTELPPIRIITIQSMASLNKSGELDHLIHDVNNIIIDETHHSASSNYMNLLDKIGHIYYRFGFSGTFLRNDSKSLDMWGFLSNVLFRYPAHKATEEGYLTPLEVVTYKLDGKKSKSYPKEYDNNYCGNPDMLMEIANICRDQKGSQILILVKNKEKSGNIIHEYLKTQGIPNSYISGDNSKEEIIDCIDDFNEKRSQVLIGSSVIGEGIDIRSTDHLIMCQGGKSEIAIVQAIGRLIRLFEGKTVGYLHDFDFENTNYMHKHYLKRMEIVKKNFAPKAFH